MFTTSAIDNIDHNPTATTAKMVFHGTSMSLFQNMMEKSVSWFPWTPEGRVKSPSPIFGVNPKLPQP